MENFYRKTYTPGDVYEYTPTSFAMLLGDKPGSIEILSDDGVQFLCRIVSGIEDLVERVGREFRVDKGSPFARGLTLKELEPCVVDSGLEFDDVFDGMMV